MKLWLKGFQSHKDTLVETRGGLTCITGPNHVGKSSVIRAVRWVFYDAHRGSKFLKKGCTEASVKIELDNHTVERSKGKSLNAYVVDGKRFDAIGTGAPPEVSETLNIRPVTVDKDLEIEVNVVRQAEPPFLVSLTGTAKAKILNALTGLHVIDVALRDTVANLRRFKMEEEKAKMQVTAYQAELEQFKGLDEAQLRVANARERLERLLKMVERARALRQASQSYQNHLSRTVNMAAPDTAKLARIEDLWLRLQGLYVKRDRLVQAQTARTQFVAVHKQLEFSNLQLERAKAQFKMLKDQPCPTCGQALTDTCLEEAA